MLAVFLQMCYFSCTSRIILKILIFMWYSTSGISPQVSVCFNLPFLQRRFLHCACKTENKLQNKIMYFSLKAKYYKDYRSHPYIIADIRHWTTTGRKLSGLLSSLLNRQVRVLKILPTEEVLLDGGAFFHPSCVLLQVVRTS